MKASLRDVALVVLAAVAISSLAVAASALLDGKAFKGECVEKGKAAGTGVLDELIFKDGKFLSTACVKYGFREAPYAAKVMGDAVAWESSSVSAKDAEGRMAWKGTVKGDVAQATLVWTKPGQNPSEWTFKGKLSKK